ncbi:MAG: ribonuclease Z [Deltaproteobacteria bacterium]|nr:ribonuclease Z [Deltaproteobacteria bacterium]
MVKIKFLGTGTSCPTLERVSSSYLLYVGEKKLLIDIGPSVLRRLIEHGLNVNEVDLIVLTHFHVDHSGDLPAFLFACNYGLEPRRRPLYLLGGDGIKQFFRNLCNCYPWIKPKHYDLQVLRVVNESYLWNEVKIITKRVNHNRESIALRLDMGVSLVFSGDTDFSRNLIELSSGVDLLVVECSFPERKVKGHLNLHTLRKMIDKAKPKQVIISHLYPEWDKRMRDSSIPCIIAYDGLEIDIG